MTQADCEHQPPFDAWQGAVTALLFAHDIPQQSAFAGPVQARALRLLGPWPLAGEADALWPASADLVLIDLMAAPDAAAEAFLAQTLPGLGEAGIAIVAAIDPAQIDLAAPYLLPLHAEILCAPDAETVDRAIARALEPAARRLNEPGVVAVDQLRDMHDHASRLAERLRGLLAAGALDLSHTAGARQVSAVTVRALIRRRRLRERFFEEELFADPAWDMLLDLYAARLEGGRVCVSSLCYAAAVPSTTALRWIAQMTKAGLLAREADPHDRRRHYMLLTERAAASMNAYFLSLAAGREFD
ncbi:MAG TPA: winged helix DNA-binding protein [Sphingomonas sp.]|nr:winged helix DNA-binding protein [Sphingomonas sp.]